MQWFVWLLMLKLPESSIHYKTGWKMKFTSNYLVNASLPPIKSRKRGKSYLKNMTSGIEYIIKSGMPTIPVNRSRNVLSVINRSRVMRGL